MVGEFQLPRFKFLAALPSRLTYGMSEVPPEECGRIVIGRGRRRRVLSSTTAALENFIEAINQVCGADIIGRCLHACVALSYFNESVTLLTWSVLNTEVPRLVGVGLGGQHRWLPLGG